jgi:hypothetical protein
VGSRAGLEAVQKRYIRSPDGNQTPAVQPVFSPYTNWAIPAHSDEDYTRQLVGSTGPK